MYPLVFGLMVFDAGYDIRVSDFSDRFSLVHQTRFVGGERYISDGLSATYSFRISDSSRLFTGGHTAFEQHYNSNQFHKKYVTISPTVYVAKSFIRYLPIRTYVQANFGKIFYVVEESANISAPDFSFSPKTEFLIGISYILSKED